jgi:hypothetical protein
MNKTFILSAAVAIAQAKPNAKTNANRIKTSPQD